jgi:hypothetical protein
MRRIDNLSEADDLGLSLIAWHVASLLAFCDPQSSSDDCAPRTTQSSRAALQGIVSYYPSCQTQRLQYMPKTCSKIQFMVHPTNASYFKGGGASPLAFHVLPLGDGMFHFRILGVISPGNPDQHDVEPRWRPGKLICTHLCGRAGLDSRLNCGRLSRSNRWMMCMH